MRYRGSGKIKKQHSMIKGLKKFLESIEQWEEIQGIVPGRIAKANLGGPLQLKIKYETISGIKAIANSYGGVQEVFFITNTPELLLNKLEALLE